MITAEQRIVSDWMSTKVITIDINDMISKVEQLFDTHNIHHLIVMEGGKLAGIISTDDLLKAYQKSEGMIADGIAGPETLIHLNSSVSHTGPTLVE